MTKRLKGLVVGAALLFCALAPVGRAAEACVLDRSTCNGIWDCYVDDACWEGVLVPQMRFELFLLMAACC